MKPSNNSRSGVPVTRAPARRQSRSARSAPAAPKAPRAPAAPRAPTPRAPTSRAPAAPKAAAPRIILAPPSSAPKTTAPPKVAGPLTPNLQSTQPKVLAPPEEPLLAPVPTKGTPTTDSFAEPEPEPEEDWGGGGVGSMVSPIDGTAGMGDPMDEGLEGLEEELAEGLAEEPLSADLAMEAAEIPTPWYKKPKVLAGVALVVAAGLYMKKQEAGPGFPEEF